jgi:methionyl-tRNA formyltransferase
VLKGLEAGTLKPKPQPTEGVTHATKLSREDGRIDWAQPAAFIDRQIRALQPWPGSFFMFGDEAIKVQKAELVAGAGVAGTLLKDDFTVACGDGALRITSLQRPGKKPIDGASFLRGTRIAAGQKL